MPAAENAEECGGLSVSDMQAWLAQELRDLDKARELRIRQATGFVNAYARGEIPPQEAGDRMFTYETRWGDALHGAIALPHLTDEQIVARMDELRAAANARTPAYYRRLARSASRGFPTENER